MNTPFAFVTWKELFEKVIPGPSGLRRSLFTTNTLHGNTMHCQIIMPSETGDGILNGW